MAAFEYQALDARGKSSKGVLEADNARHARALLREQKLTPVSVAVASQQEKMLASGKQWFKASISASELALLTRQLATLVEAALPIESALLAVAEQCDKPRLKNMVMTVRSKVVEGYSLAEGLAEFPHVFDHLFRSMVAAGEKSGHLDQVLNRLADYTEQRQHMRNQILMASIYPVVMVVVAVAIIAVLLSFVVPKITEQFEYMGQQLPALTRFMIGASEFVQSYGLALVVGIALAIIGWKRLLQRPQIRLNYDRRLLKVKVIGRIVSSINTARFARTLSILNASGVPLLEAMRISADVLDNTYMKQSVADATARVREGTSLKNALEQTKLFPPMMLHMIASGEKSGQLDTMLERAANTLDREFEMTMTVSLEIFKPAVVIILAAMVFMIVLSILLPILALNNMIGR
ncbi:type II secretion system inner membrane protein GspF [Rheinheimera baltica]|uniref:Type II secretion system inner membrane protein GspF n=1 Tax=Rheinheimera baltica TaxID=67576 RepID=A0ABT9HVJ5_9GAMM|nr:type II secretion system inner membrane protein GspF [Rheinheimera baltica]MDP5135145.1 type II secretion system inner membrane protein GspF [Rheinheimera baltica]MDP5143572.1 type II secretion system inner membrane protein GspF [Rheinheimera baltica]MDP5151073.1 type II secretion system inner membrane protein GspF [Rheinheimera baltica]MDP5189021.1 type II secretion system inner membrane protein GspF [Rheinheimera baltica]